MKAIGKLRLFEKHGTYRELESGPWKTYDRSRDQSPGN